MGGIAPLLLLVVTNLNIIPLERMPDWLMVVLWPAFGFVMAIDTGGFPSTAGIAFGWLMSFVFNILIYGLVGVLVSFLYRRLFGVQSQGPI